MGQFDKEIERLQERLQWDYKSKTPEDVKLITEAIERLKKLDGWEPGGLASRVEVLEERIDKQNEVVEALIEAVNSLLDSKRRIGFNL